MNTSFNSTQNLPPSDNNSEAKSIKLLQKGLEETKARNRQLLASLPQIVWFSQVNGEITEFNQRWYEYTGLSSQASLGWEFLKVLHPEDRDRFVALFNLACQTPQPCECSCRLLGLEGYNWFVAQLIPIIDQEQISQWLGICTLTSSEDIAPPLLKAGKTSPKQRPKPTIATKVDELAKYRLRNLEKELAHTIVWETHATSSQYTFVSKSAEKVLGYPVQSWLTEANFWVNLIHPEDRQWTVALSQKEIGHSRDYELEYRCLAADQRVVWLRDRVCVIRDDRGQVSKRRGMMVDITIAKHAEAELCVRKRQQTVIAQLGQKAQFGNQVSQLIDEGMALVSQALAVEYCQVLEYLPHQQQLLLQAGIGWQDGLIGKALIEASPNTHAGYTLHCGQPIIVEDLLQEKRFRGSAMLHDHGVVSGVNVIIEAKPSSVANKSKHFGVLGAHSRRRRKFSHSDVDFLQAIAHVLATAIANQQSNQELVKTKTQLAQTQTALAKSTQEFEQFTYVASHDLKAPLRAIANLSQWLEEDIAEQLNSENRQQLQLLQKRVYRIEAMIEGLLQYSRIGRIKTELEWVDVVSLLTEVIDTLVKPPDFTIEIGPGMPRLYTERLQLKQVFQHLLQNAITHHPSSNPKVTVKVKHKLDCYEFTVSDNGAGIAPQFQERVFGIFQTLQGRDITENVGVGLAIVKKIVESQGGTVQLNSQEGKGASFRFTWQKRKE